MFARQRVVEKNIVKITILEEKYMRDMFVYIATTLETESFLILTTIWYNFVVKNYVQDCLL